MIKKTNSTIMSKLLSLRGDIDHLILALGYIDVTYIIMLITYSEQIDEEHYAFVGDYFTVLKRGTAKLEKKLTAIKVQFMTPEERKKHELLEEQKRLYKAELQKKKESKDQIARQSQCDRIEKSQEEPAKDAKANQLRYGANIVKFQPPVNKGG